MLRGVTVFGELTDYELENIAKLAQVRTYEPDHRVFAEGALARRMFVLLDGEVEIRIRQARDSEQITVDTINKNEIFGWSALTQPYSLTAAAWVTKKSTVVGISGDLLRDLFEKNNHIGYLVMKGAASVISGRLMRNRVKMLELLPSPETEG
jgi:CRP/FNR family transcriptional regulator